MHLQIYRGVDMRVLHFRLLRASSSALLSFCCMGGEARSQETTAQGTTTLPEVTVSAPSPIVRRAPPRPARPAPVAVRRQAPAPTPARAPAAAPVPRPAVAPPPPVVAEPPQLAGTLPIVTDQFATVTVIPGSEIARSTAENLGDVLFSKPGMTSSTPRTGRQPPRHPRPGQFSCPHPGKRNRQRRCLGHRRGPRRDH